jgi:hypothetical protein
MKYLYIVDYWVPFPQSEYGGIVNVIADNEIEVFDILRSEEKFPSEYVDLIMNSVVKAQKFALVDDYESGIIDVFVT